jgi:hypothetical protein
MTKDISGLIDESKQNLAFYLDVEVYVPVKEELIGVEHSLGIRKELFKSYIDSELERLKVAIIKYVTSNTIVTSDATTSVAVAGDATSDVVVTAVDDKNAEQEE